METKAQSDRVWNGSCLRGVWLTCVLLAAGIAPAQDSRLLAMASSGVRIQEQAPAEGETWLATGERLIAEGRLAEALSFFSQQKQVRPQDPIPYFYSGLALVQREDWSGASAELLEATRLGPDHMESKVLYGNVLTRLGHNELAVEALAAFGARPKLEELNNAWLWLLSDTFYRAGSNDEALKVLDLLAERTPDDPKVDLNRGQVHFVRGDHEVARDYLQASIARQPKGNPIAHFELGKVLQQLGDTEGAKQAFREAVQQDPGNVEFLWKLGAVCLAREEIDEAIGYLEQAKPGAEVFPEIYYSLGRAYQARKDRENAAENLRKFQEASNRDRKQEYQRIEGGKLVGKGEDALDQGDTRKALEWFTRAVETDPDSWSAHGYLAELYLAANSTFLGCLHSEKALELDPDHPVGLYLMARCHSERGEFEQAIELGEQVRRVRPNHAALRNFLGNLYLRQGRLEDSVMEYRAAVSLEPERSEFQLNLEAAERKLREGP